MATRWVIGSLWTIGTVLAAPAGAALCAPVSGQINDNNNIIMLGGTSKGPIRQVVVGEFGKDVHEQSRLLGKFDRCGRLLAADMNSEKQEGGVLLKIGQKVVRVSGGWQAEYEISVSVLKQGRPVEVSHKQGRVSYLTGRNGAIVSASDGFVLNGENGFTTTVYDFDRQQRLTGSVSRGTDALSNDRVTYRWSRGNQLIAIDAQKSHTRMTYDSRQRELQMRVQRSDPFSLETAVDSCQLWDERDNCTLNYSHQTEVRSRGIIVRNLAAGYRFEYWDDLQEPAAAE